jgi:hypothetical protein
MIGLDEIRAQLGDRALVRRVDELTRGHVRITTSLLYPDGSFVDVFVRRDQPTRSGSLSATPIVLSDLGQTTAWLLDVGIKPWLSKKRKTFIEDAISLYGVEQAGGELRLEIHSPEALVSGVLRLGQACIRVADLTFTRRDSLVEPIEEEFESFLSDAELPYHSNVELPGMFEKGVRVDFLVTGKSIESAVLMLTSTTASGAHTAANEVFRRWRDLRGVPSWNKQPITVLDHRRFKLFRDDDLKRIELEGSHIFGLDERKSLLSALAS